MTGWTWVRAKLAIRRQRPEPEPQPPAKPQELAEWVRRCPVCRKLKVQPGENPGLFVGVCQCDLKVET